MAAKNRVRLEGVGHRHRGGAFWRGVLAQWARSGLTQTEFCRRRGVSIATFRSWRYALARRERSAVRRRGTRTGADARFVRVHVARSAAATNVVSERAGSIELILEGGRVVRVGRGFDGAVLVALLRVLRSVPC